MATCKKSSSDVEAVGDGFEPVHPGFKAAHAASALSTKVRGPMSKKKGYAF